MDSQAEVLASDIYEKSNYRKAAGTLASIARASGTEIPGQTLQNWEIFMFTMRQVDSYIDESPDFDTAKERMDEILDFMEGEKIQIGEQGSNLQISTSQLRDTITSLPPKDRELIFRETSGIFDLEAKARLTKNPKEFATTRRLIGQKTARLLLAFIGDVGQRNRVHKLFRLMGRFGTETDTLVDWRRDYQKLEHQLLPSIPNLIPTISSSTRDFISIIQKHGLTLAKNFSRLSSAVIKTATGEKRKPTPHQTLSNQFTTKAESGK